MEFVAPLVMACGVSTLCTAAMAVVEPLIDPLAEGIARGVVTVYSAYEKTQPPSGPMYLCEVGCPDKLLKCPKFHTFTDCEDWAMDKTKCNGSCGKYHRKCIGGRGFHHGVKLATKVTLTRTQFIEEQPIYGNVSVGLRWDVNPNPDSSSYLGPVNGVRVRVTMGNWENINLACGIFGLNGELLRTLFPDEGYFITRSVKDEDLIYDDGAVKHHGNDPKGGPEGRKKELNYGFNEVLSVDFSKIKEDVGSIVFCVSLASDQLLPALLNAELALFQTPTNNDSTSLSTPPFLTVKLQSKDELKYSTGYVFGKFSRTHTGWKFVPIRHSCGLTSSEPIIQTVMPVYAAESTSASVPVMDPKEIDFRILTLTNDRQFYVPIKSVNFVCFDVFGKRVPKQDLMGGPFECTPLPTGDVQLMCNNTNKLITTVFIWVDHGALVPSKMTNFFVVGDKDEPILCGTGNLGASRQFIARIGSFNTSRWEINAYATPLKADRDPDDAVADIAHGRRLVPLVDNKLQVLRDVVVPAEARNGASEYGRLTIEVLRGKNLAVKDLLSSDPYVSVRFGPHKFKTSIQKNTVHPTWNFATSIDIASETIDSTVISFSCKDWNKVSKTVAMGVAKIDLMDLLTGNLRNNEEMKLNLAVNPKHPKQNVSGHIVVKVYFS